MSDVLLELTFKFPNWLEKIENAREEIELFTAAMMQTNRGMLFDKEGAYNGHQKWKALKFRKGQILSNRGILRRSIAPMSPTGRPGENGIVRIESDTITIGTNVFYARLMNDGTAKMPGGVLRAVNAKALKIPVPSGEGATRGANKLSKGAKMKGHTDERGQSFIFRKSVKIPARPFDTWTKEDEDELSAAVMNKIIQVLNRT